MCLFMNQYYNYLIKNIRDCCTWCRSFWTKTIVYDVKIKFIYLLIKIDWNKIKWLLWLTLIGIKLSGKHPFYRSDRQNRRIIADEEFHERLARKYWWTWEDSGRRAIKIIFDKLRGFVDFWAGFMVIKECLWIVFTSTTWIAKFFVNQFCHFVHDPLGVQIISVPRQLEFRVERL